MNKLLFRIQQFVAVTEIEAKVFSVVLFLLFLGLGVRYAQANWFVDEFKPAVTSLDTLAPPFAGVPQAIAFDTTESERDTTEIASDEPSGRQPPALEHVDINTATSAELQTLPGIGPALAARILEYRRRQGQFTSVSQLTEVRGIGKKTLERLSPLIVAQP